MGVWADHATTRRDLVRRSFDVYRAAELRLSPSLQTPPRRVPIGRSYKQIVVSEPYVAMTFDDGPHPDNTPRLLDTLATRGVRASFYVIGEAVTRHPDIVRRALGEGHEVGSHTWSHRFLTTQSAHSIVRELTRAHAAIEAAAGISPAMLRPPYGAVTPALVRWIDHQFGYPSVLWSTTAQDWDEPDPEVITDRLVSRITSGAIVLNHDTLDPTVEAMPGTLDRLLDRGFRFVTVSELVELGETSSGQAAGLG